MINSNIMEILKPVLLGLKELCYVKRELINIYGTKRKAYIMIMTLLKENNQFMNLLLLIGHFGPVVPVTNRLKIWCMCILIKNIFNIFFFLSIHSFIYFYCFFLF